MRVLIGWGVPRGGPPRADNATALPCRELSPVGVPAQPPHLQMPLLPARLGAPHLQHLLRVHHRAAMGQVGSCAAMGGLLGGSLGGAGRALGWFGGTGGSSWGFL